MAIPRGLLEIERRLQASFINEFGREPNDIEKKLILRQANNLWTIQLLRYELRKASDRLLKLTSQQKDAGTQGSGGTNP